MTIMWIGVLCFSLVLAYVALTRTSEDPFSAAERKRPKELAGAVVVEPHTPLAMFEPFQLHGEPDVIYRTVGGTLVLREDKSGLAYPHPLAELIQISVYGAILRHNPPDSLRGCPVEPYGWVRHGIPGKTATRWTKVRLFTDEELSRVIARYREIQAGATGRRTSDSGYCQKVCRHFKKKCHGND